MDARYIVTKIETALAEKGIKKGDFYAATGVSSATLSQWRNGVYFPSAEKLNAIENYLGIRFEIKKESPGISAGAEQDIIDYLLGLPKDTLRGILQVTGAPKELLAALDQQEQP